MATTSSGDNKTLESPDIFFEGPDNSVVNPEPEAGSYQVNDKRAFAEDMRFEREDGKVPSLADIAKRLMEKEKENLSITPADLLKRIQKLEAENEELKKDLLHAKHSTKPGMLLRLSMSIMSLKDSFAEATKWTLSKAFEKPALTTALLAIGTLAAMKVHPYLAHQMQQVYSGASLGPNEVSQVASSPNHVDSIVQHLDKVVPVAKPSSPLQEHIQKVHHHVAKVINKTREILNNPPHNHVEKIKEHVKDVVLQHAQNVHAVVSHVAEFVPQKFWSLEGVRDHINDLAFTRAQEMLQNVPGGDIVLQAFHPDHAMHGDTIAQQIYLDGMNEHLAAQVNFLQGMDHGTVKSLQDCFVFKDSQYIQIKPIPDNVLTDMVKHGLENLSNDGVSLSKAAQSVTDRLDYSSVGLGDNTIKVTPDNLSNILSGVIEHVDKTAKVYSEQVVAGQKTLQGFGDRG